MRRALRGVLLAALCLTSVRAEAALQLISDGRSVNFGQMESGETSVLSDQGSYHNTVTCSSTNGLPWYLKVHVLDALSSGIERIPLDAFEWQLVSTTGHGESTASLGKYKPFMLQPDLIYFSASDETSGMPVAFQFKYRLRVPENIVYGVYYTNIRFTLTEVL